MKLFLFAAALYVGYRIATENRAAKPPVKLLAPPRGARRAVRRDGATRSSVA